MNISFKAIISILLAAVVLIGCTNTMQGVGKDMQANGQAIQKSTQS
ncbi:MAG: hypothetical protein ACD_45C00003G0001 [uncultured bacterium]|nr:MAG: hypothetical protein ACD_45C00003G0001 [uncultured bacterium]